MTSACTLSADFHPRGRLKLDELLGRAVPSAAEPPAAEPPAAEPYAAEPLVPAAVATIEDKLVRLEARGRRGTLLKEPPASIAALASAEDLELYGLEALKKLARLSGLDVPKSSGREAVLAALREKHGE